MRDEEVHMEVPVVALASLGATATESEQRSALTALFHAEFSRVYGFVLSRCGSAHVAEDIAAETFAEAARTVRAGNGDWIGAPWLFTVARRRLIDHWRRVERQRKRTERVRLERSDHDQLPGMDRIEDDRILDALASLPTRQRAALTLRYLDDYSVTEVAETLDVSYKAAESLLSRARSAFAEYLEHPYG